MPDTTSTLSVPETGPLTVSSSVMVPTCSGTTGTETAALPPPPSPRAARKSTSAAAPPIHSFFLRLNLRVFFLAEAGSSRISSSI